MRPGGPSGNSHDRQVVVTVLERQRGPKDGHEFMAALRASIVLLSASDADLTVRAIIYRRFAPQRDQPKDSV